MCLARRQRVAKLCVGVHGRFFEKTLSGMEKLANERVVEPRLPLLYESQFEAAVVGSINKQRNWSPNVQVVVLLPEAKRQFSLDKLVIGKLQKFPGATVLEANVDALGKEKCSCKKIAGVLRRGPQMIEIGTPFQN